MFQPMYEFLSVSASSYDPVGLAAKLTEVSAQGWEVVSIVQTGGDVTAFVRRMVGEPRVSSDAAAVVATSDAPVMVVDEPVAVDDTEPNVVEDSPGRGGRAQVG